MELLAWSLWKRIVAAFPFVILVMAASERQATAEVSSETFLGVWEGRATAREESVGVSLELAQRNGALAASLTLLEMGVMEWPARRVQIEGDQVELEFPADSSQQVFVMSAVGSGKLNGHWRDSRFEAPARLSLERVRTPRSPVGRSVDVNGPGGKLSVEILIPEGEGPFPGIVFLHGSGPQPKDASRFGAVALARYGIASAFYDKRGVGGSEGNWKTATFEQLASDAIAVGKHLLASGNVSKVGLSGQSQGGWVGPLAASEWKEAAFVINIAGPAVSPAREAQWVYVHNVRKWGGNGRHEEEVRGVLDAFHASLRSGDTSTFEQAIAHARSRPWFEASGLAYLDLPQDDAWLAGYLATMDYDPIPILKNLDVPLLSILSPDDESIDTQETMAILRSLSLDEQRFKLVLYPGYNHGMRRVGGGEVIRWPSHPKNYFETQAAFVERALSE